VVEFLLEQGADIQIGLSAAKERGTPEMIEFIERIIEKREGLRIARIKDAAVEIQID
jgi:hypothetical protein